MANMGINHFVSNITEGLASPNRYTVEFNNPAGGNDPSISMMCNISQLPGRTIKPFETGYYYSPKIALEHEFQPITFSFISQIGFKERKYFEKWQSRVINSDSNMPHFFDDYKGNIIISHLNQKTGNPDYRCELLDTWPSALSEIGMGYSMANETMVQSVTFVYWYWKTL